MKRLIIALIAGIVLIGSVAYGFNYNNLPVRLDTKEFSYNTTITYEGIVFTIVSTNSTSAIGFVEFRATGGDIQWRTSNSATAAYLTIGQDQGWWHQAPVRIASSETFYFTGVANSTIESKVILY